MGYGQVRQGQVRYGMARQGFFSTGVIMTRDEACKIAQGLMDTARLTTACREYGLDWGTTREFVDMALNCVLDWSEIRNILLTKEPDTIIKVPKELAEYLSKLV